MAHNHTRPASEGRLEKKLTLTIALNLFITLVQIAGGIVSGSLALLSDAVHNLGDSLALILSAVAVRMSRRPKTPKHTFGWKRAELLAALVNATVLAVICVFLIREAVGRFSSPNPIAGGLMLAVAAAGFLANFAGMALLRRDSRKNINVRSAYVHLMGDAVSSLAVIAGAAAIVLFRAAWIDPVLTILISLYILKETVGILKESADMVLMTSPAGIDLGDVQRSIESVPGVKNVHHGHLWKLSDADVHFEAHVDVDDMPVSRTERIQKRIEKILRDRFRVTHTTLQFECDKCKTKKFI
ncbi:cation transporter [bacterium]|nr:cation transporter [bacterium]